MHILAKILGGYLITINSYSFLLFGYDKLKSKLQIG